MLTSACRDRALEGCSSSFAAARYEEAARLCDAAYQGSHDPRAGATAARALGKLGRADEALAWIERLKGTSAEPGLWSVAGALYHQRGESGRAASAFRRDLTLLAAAGDHAQASKARYGLFYLAWEDSRYREALEEARLAYEEARTADTAEYRELQARALEGLYTVLYALGDFAGARRALDLAVRLLPPMPPEKEIDRARLLNNQGGLDVDEGRPELARHELEQAVLLLRGHPEERRLLRSAHLNLVQAALAGGDLPRATEHLRQAWRSAEPGGQPETALLYYRARVARAGHRLAEAERDLAAALAADPVPDWAWDLEHERGLVAEERGDLAAAEQAYQRSASIVDEMRRSLAFDELKAWLLDRKRQPLESLFLLRARAGRATEALAVVERATARTFQDAFIQAAVREPSSARDVWAVAADRVDALRELLPAMSESPVVAPVPAERALAAARDHRVLLYFEARGEIWLLEITGGRARPLRLGASAGRIAGLVDAWLAAPDDRALAGTLGDLLLPAALRLPPGTTLHVIPDGALTRVPFAALRRGGRYLVEDHAVVYVPGLSALAASPALPAAGRTPAARPVVLADPGRDLPAAAAEGREVAALLGASLHLGAAADAGALAAAAGAPVLHIAGHAGWGPGGPWLELADRRIEPGAILSARLRPRLVVLASCASAFPGGRGLWGSPGVGFLAAGSEAVLASLGSVEDRSAHDLVLRFYREGGAEDPAGGLARAQRALLAAGRPPSAWAPFVLLGAHLY
jgi:tetratricopeptide (TPR) repeat protein